MSNLYWLSFADPAMPAGTQFLGACLVRAESPMHAVRAARMLGCNPGGEVLIHSLSSVFEKSLGGEFVARWMNRLLTIAECHEFDREAGKRVLS